MSSHKPLPLSGIKSGTYVTIVTIPDNKYKAQFIRFGIIEGERVLCLTRLPGGTLIIQKNRQEIAIGPALTKKILVVLGSKLSSERRDAP
jgi:Fe2+ transport system protein FeoA